MTDPGPGGATVAQRLIWAGQQLSPDSPLYNMAVRVDFPVAVDPGRFGDAFDVVVAQSDAMRTVFTSPGGVAVPRVLPHVPAALEQVDLSGEADPEKTATAWIDERARRPFDLGQANYASALLRLGPERWTWFFAQHHVATDAWSTALVHQRLGEAYARFPEAPEPPPPFAAHVDQETARTASRSFAVAREHWQHREADEGRLLRLYGTPATASRGESRRHHLPLGTERLERLARLVAADGVRMLSVDLTRFALFATALVAYLARVSGEQTVTFGSPAHNRRTPGARQTPGLFVEVFPLRVVLDEGETFRSLLAKVAAETHAFVLHGQPGASTPATVRLFNVVLNYLNVTFGSFGDLPTRVEWVHPGASDPGHALRVHVHDLNGTGELEVLFDINTSLFDDEASERLPRHFLRVLDALLADLDAPVGTVPLALEEDLTDQEDAGRSTGATPTDEETVVTLFEGQAAAAPDAIALRQAGQAMTYGELEARSRRVAGELITRGVAAGDIVGVHARRSIEMVTAVLGVLRAGAAYVPLEARLPEQRLRLILEDTGARLVITAGDGAGALPDLGVQTMEIGPGLASKVSLPPPAPDATAYVIYTSGSTGRPKGVVVDHRVLAEYTRWAHRTFAGEGPASFPLHTAFGFDLTVTSLFVPLVSGGEIVVYPEPAEGPDLSVLQVFEDDAVDVVKLTPAHLGLVVDQGRPPGRIRALIVGGEDLKTTLARRATEVLGGRVAVFNEYGPTEAVVGCMEHRFDPAKDRDSSVPIGGPASGVHLYVLDEGGNPVPTGVEGELYVGGDRLARGYLGRDDLTAERFLPDPFRPGGRMYRTGDRARVSRGHLEYRGRTDDQVKIRGVRVEIAEVEHALAAHPAVRSCVVDTVVPGRPSLEGPPRFCSRCGLSSRYPGARFDDEGRCHLCRDFESYQANARAYFRPMNELKTTLAEAGARRTGPWDCLMLLSGGKDSTYALYQVARLTPRILTMTLDNGYISDGAKANIRRATEALGVEHRFLTAPGMNEIFVDSLERHSNVCNGCFKTIYTLAVQTALAEGIPAIVTGLSRGQFFETRLTPELFQGSAFDPETVDRMVLEARKAYHRVEDAVAEHMDVRALRRDDTWDKVTFIDFYRYCDVSVEEVYRFLADHGAWVRPEDTGRSTNCLINEVGIFVHQRREGYHSYALPYSWDVRLGHKTRDGALEELDDDIDPRRVATILEEIGFEDDVVEAPHDARLVGYFTASEAVTPAALRAHLAERLIDPMVPSYLVELDEIPLTSNGKVDRRALPDPRARRSTSGPAYRAPRTPAEEALVELWREALGIGRVGIDDDFYDLGGDSITAIQIAARARDRGLELAVSQLFEHPTVAALAPSLEASREATAVSGKTARPGRFELASLDAAGLDKVARILEKRRGDR